MRETAQAALWFWRLHADYLEARYGRAHGGGLDPCFHDVDVHLHFCNPGFRTGGGSAGLAILRE